MLADGSGPGDYNSDADIITDLNATVEYLRSHSAVDGELLGITGFCVGGRTTWLGAATNPHFKAAVPFFGGNIMVPRGNTDQSPFDRTSGMKCPVLFHFGGIDTNPSPDDQAKYDAELTRLGVPHVFYSYQTANHAFMDYNRDRYQKEASEIAWPRTLEFLAAHLKR
jgi:carboxymethylenebutenolidase